MRQRGMSCCNGDKRKYESRACGLIFTIKEKLEEHKGKMQKMWLANRIPSDREDILLERLSSLSISTEAN
jgi:hypothetical protein